MHCSPSIRNRRESCFIVGIKEAKSSSMSRYRDSLSSPLFFHFSIDHCRRRGGCEARGCFGRKCDLSRAMRLSRSVISIDHLSRSWLDRLTFIQTQLLLGWCSFCARHACRDWHGAMINLCYGVRNSRSFFKYLNKISFLCIFFQRNEQKLRVFKIYLKRWFITIQIGKIENCL